MIIYGFGCDNMFVVGDTATNRTARTQLDYAAMIYTQRHPRTVAAAMLADSPIVVFNNEAMEQYDADNWRRLDKMQYVSIAPGPDLTPCDIDVAAIRRKSTLRSYLDPDYGEYVADSCPNAAEIGFPTEGKYGFAESQLYQTEYWGA